MDRAPQLTLFLVTLLLILVSVEACVKTLFFFGDSHFDAGNNPYIKNCPIQANFTPYGVSFFKHPTGRFSEGRTIADFFAEHFGIEFQKPFQELANGKLKEFPSNGINFASGGSGTLPTTNKDQGVTTMKGQLQQFQDSVDKKHVHKTLIENSIFFLESGSIDLLNYFVEHDSSNPKAYVQAMLKEVDLFIDTIHKLGGHKIVIASVGPIGCVPSRIALMGIGVLFSRCFDKVNKMAEDYNAGLEVLVKNTSKKYPGTIGVYASLYSVVQKILKSPKQYGFSNAHAACCGGGIINGMLQCGLKGYNMCSNRSEYFFWDYIHPSERAYKLLSDTLWAGTHDQIWPINLKTLACTATFN